MGDREKSSPVIKWPFKCSIFYTVIEPDIVLKKKQNLKFKKSPFIENGNCFLIYWPFSTRGWALHVD